MKAAIINNFDGIKSIKIADAPPPSTQANEVCIQVAYAGVNPVDWKICEGLLKSRMPFEFPIILGWDVSGIISSIGSNVKNFKVGDKVFAYARKASIKWGTFAEFVTVEADNVVLVPQKLTLKEAAAYPLSGLTAWQSLVDAAKLKKGEVILIHGGSGGVGAFAIQIAKNIGAEILTTASKENHDYVTKLGATTTIDYHTENFVEKIKKIFPKGIDVVFDTVGGKTFEDSCSILRKGGRIVSLLQDLDKSLAAKYGIEGHYVFVKPSGKDLQDIAKLIDAGKLLPPPITIYPLDKASEALEQVKLGKIRGKIILEVNPNNA